MAPQTTITAMKMEHVAEDVMDYLRKREARRAQLYALLEEKNNPALYTYPSQGTKT